MKIQKFVLCFILLIMPLMATGCGTIQKDYYEIKVIVVNEEAFYFIDPTEGKDTFSQNKFGSGENQFLYLYEPIEGVDFNYNQFFSSIGSKFIEENLQNGKYYLMATKEIDNLINQYFFDRDAWQAAQS